MIWYPLTTARQTKFGSNSKPNFVATLPAQLLVAARNHDSATIDLSILQTMVYTESNGRFTPLAGVKPWHLP